MKYLEIVKKLQNLSCNTDVLVLVRSGVFFYGVGKDAIILTENLGLNYSQNQSTYFRLRNVIFEIES